ncbi:CvpA family protein [Dethiobacter alkaliphilus]|uniref:Colicin V production protein n=1 Tax=Dethiobacter alkaliphilus AHT 1 TaxID=555088 RepID=C0GJM1_DETAL|nr:CvpA family protein [Dethiobacter alkaliphilus]EEG76443.1 Colicin V production protein [Dethiobacter alkaliphilus AHT 1]
MNWLDVLLILLFIFSISMGWRRGLIRQLFDVAAVIAAYAVALFFGREFVLWLNNFIPLAEWFPAWFSETSPLGFAVGEILLRLLGFFILFFAVRLVFRVVGGLLHSIFCLPVLGTINGAGGMLMGMLKGLLLILIIVAAGQLISTPFWQQTMQQSLVASVLLDILPVVYDQMVRFLLGNQISVTF